MFPGTLISYKGQQGLSSPGSPFQYFYWSYLNGLVAFWCTKLRPKTAMPWCLDFTWVDANSARVLVFLCVCEGALSCCWSATHFRAPIDLNLTLAWQPLSNDTTTWKCPLQGPLWRHGHHCQSTWHNGSLMCPRKWLCLGALLLLNGRAKESLPPSGNTQANRCRLATAAANFPLPLMRLSVAEAL